jgi:hypothetical protein
VTLVSRAIKRKPAEMEITLAYRINLQPSRNRFVRFGSSHYPLHIQRAAAVMEHDTWVWKSFN